MDNEAMALTARRLIEVEFVGALFEAIAASAVNAAVAAAPTDNELRAAMMAEIRAVRNLHGKLKALAAAANPDDRSAPV